MPTAAVLLADGFEEIEAVTLIDVLRRAQVEVTTLGVGGTRVVGSHQIPLLADVALADAEGRAWDVVVLPGGMPGSARLRDDARVQQLVRRQAAAGKRLAAICAAPIALGRAGVLEGRRATCFPGFEPELRGAVPSVARVEHDGNVITSRAAGTAMELALHLVVELRGPEVAAELATAMMVAPR